MEFSYPTHLSQLLYTYNVVPERKSVIFRKRKRRELSGLFANSFGSVGFVPLMRAIVDIPYEKW